MISAIVSRNAARALRCGVAALAGLLVAAPAASAQGTLTAGTVYSTTSSGAFDFSDYYNTRNGDYVYNLYFSSSANGSAILNPGTTLSTPLSLGTNTFYLFGDAGSTPGYYGFNLFLDGGTTPFLSGYVTSNGGTFLTNAGQTSFEGTRVGVDAPLTIAAAGTTFEANGFLYTLTGFNFNTTGGTVDIASPLVLGPNGVTDYFGSISINVAAVNVTTTPEPSTIVLTASGLLGLVGVSVRRKRSAATA
jgi:hypothetical protein